MHQKQAAQDVLLLMYKLYLDILSTSYRMA